MSRDLRSMRPKLRSSVYFAPADDGVFLFNGGEGVVVAGASVYAWVERLAPFLDGRHTVAELVADLPAERRAAVERVVGMLDGRGLLRDLSQDVPHGLTERELETYAPEITFIEEFHDSAAHRFERYRNARILAVGSGDPLVALVAGTLRSGTRSLTVVCAGKDEGEPDRVRGYAEERAGHDPDQRVECHVRADAELEAADLRRLVSAADLVMHIADGADVERARLVDRLCAETGTASCQAVTVDDEGWVGPFRDPARGDAPWEAVWRRLRPRPDAATADAEATGPVAGILANHLTFTCFHRLTCDGGPPDELLRLDLETLETARHRATPLLPAPPTGPERAAAAVAELERGEPLTDADLARRIAPLVDTRFGVLRDVDERHYDQFPLRVAEASLWDPSAPPGREPLSVYGAAIDLADARRQAILRAIGRHASLMAGARLGGDPVAGVSLLDGTPRTVPASALLPSAEPGGVTGVAAALSWQDAVEAALLDQWTELVVRSPEPRGPAARIDLAGLPPDEPGARFRDVLDLLGREYAVHDLTADERVPTFAFTLSGRTVAYSSGLTAAEAIRAGLPRLLLAYQASATGQPEYAPEPVPQVPLDGAGSTRAVASSDAAPSGQRRRSVLVEAFQAAGRTPVVVPLDHDPAVARALPYVLQVVLLSDD